MKYILAFISALLISSCAFAPVRDMIGYTEKKCTGMGFVPGTEAHANCQLELELRYSKNAAIRSHGYLTRDK